MNNPLMQFMKPNTSSSQVTASNPSSGNMLQQFLAFKSQFQGDPVTAIRNFVASKSISQEQLNQVVELAKQFMQTNNIGG